MDTADAQLRKRMDQLDIHEQDLEEKFIHGSGPGGQKINKTASCVYLKHLPTGIEVKCQEARSRERNRHLARAELCRRLEAKRQAQAEQRGRIRARARYRARKPSKRKTAQRLHAKRLRGEKKRLRRRPGPGD